ncbi:hypothetical protein F5141DRAFT_1145408, partial [Pisolithus sp. B1]
MGPSTREDRSTRSSDVPSTLYSDQFGFRQVIVAATIEGILYGLDSSDGRVIWRRLFGLGWASDRADGRVFPVKMYVLPEKVGHVADDGGKEGTMNQTVVVVTQRRAHNVAYPTWRIVLGPGETIWETIRNGKDVGQGLSLGKVLGDRRRLYKYLNRHLKVVLTEVKGTVAQTGLEESLGTMCGLYVLDSVEGTVLYRVRLPAPERRCDDVRAALVDHWLVYAYFEDGTDAGGDGTKGWRIVSVEMYEGKKPDDVTRSLELSSYSNSATDITTYEQAYLIPHAVHSVPRRLLDLRRPLSKVSPSEADERLVTYEVVLPDDARLAISHNYEVANIRQIMSAPSQLESTSLVLAIGLDLFLTCISPSGT